jgi:group I intron endonuclease
MSILYKIVNVVNQKWYVGSSKHKSRWNSHKFGLRRNKHGNPRLQNAWNKHGENNFKFVVLEEFDYRQDATSKEQLILNEHVGKDHCYNVSRSAHGNGKTRKKGHSEETKRKIGKANTGKRLGIKDSDEARKNKSIATGKRYANMTNEDLQKAFGHSRGKKRPKEDCEKIRAGLMGHIVSDESKEKMRQKALGRKRSQESIENQKKTIRENQKRGKKINRKYKPLTEEHKLKISEAFKRRSVI